MSETVICQSSASVEMVAGMVVRHRPTGIEHTFLDSTGRLGPGKRIDVIGFREGDFEIISTPAPAVPATFILGQCRCGSPTAGVWCSNLCWETDEKSGLGVARQAAYNAAIAAADRATQSQPVIPWRSSRDVPPVVGDVYSHSPEVAMNRYIATRLTAESIRFRREGGTRDMITDMESWDHGGCYVWTPPRGKALTATGNNPGVAKSASAPVAVNSPQPTAEQLCDRIPFDARCSVACFSARRHVEAKAKEPWKAPRDYDPYDVGDGMDGGVVAALPRTPRHFSPVERANEQCRPRWPTAPYERQTASVAIVVDLDVVGSEAGEWGWTP